MYADLMWMFTKCSQLFEAAAYQMYAARAYQMYAELGLVHRGDCGSSEIVGGVFWGAESAPAEGVMKEWVGLCSVGPLSSFGVGA